MTDYNRKAQTNGLSIIPIPGDPFALPSQNSDPIRGNQPTISSHSNSIHHYLGPIYVNLDTECLLMAQEDSLFQNFAKDSWDQRLFLFRESIVKRFGFSSYFHCLIQRIFNAIVRFGFVACTTDPNIQMSSATFSTHHQYIHCTGNCFVLIPTRLVQTTYVN